MDLPSHLYHFALRLTCALSIVLLLSAIYLLAIRPAELHWGATADEIQRSYPQDDVIARPAFDATRAITIRARPEEIWPWLAQMGYGRAGFYGYDLIENPGGGRPLRSSTVILPQFQHPHPCEVLPLSVAASLRFGVVEPSRTLVWLGREDPPRGVFVWSLVPVDATHTRLISRIRWRYLDGPLNRVLGLFTEFADHVAVRAILSGVRDRAEGRRPASLVLQGAEIAAWLLAFTEFTVGLAWLLFSRRLMAPALFSLGAGLLLQFLLYAHTPAWLNAPLPWLYLALAGMYRRRVRRSAFAAPTATLVSS